jgi:hypothetical protein
MDAIRSRAQALSTYVTGHPVAQKSLTEIGSTSTLGLILFAATPMILGLCTMSYVAKRDTVQNSNVLQLLIAFSVMVGVFLFGIALTFYKGNESGLTYFILGICMLCFMLVVGNGGISVLITDAYNTSSQWIKKADQ